MYRKVTILIFVIFAFAINFLTIIQREGTFLFYGIGQLILGFLYVIALLYVIVNRFIDKSFDSSLNKSYPLIVGIVLLLTFPLVSFLIKTDGGKKNIIECGAGGDLTSVSLDLREDGTFRL